MGADIQRVLLELAAFESSMRRELARHEASRHRVVFLEDTYTRLDKLSVDQDELFREALRAVEVGLYRAAHVLAWAGFMDFLHNHLWDEYAAPLRSVRPAWIIAGPDDFREQTDYAVIEAGKAAGAFSRTAMKALHGLLNKRNECAHPSGYFPDLNGALGYISDVLARVDALMKAITDSGH